MSPGESPRRHKHPLVTSTAGVDPAGEKTLDLTKGGFGRSGSGGGRVRVWGGLAQLFKV